MNWLWLTTAPRFTLFHLAKQEFFEPDTPSRFGYLSVMSFTEVLRELPSLTLQQRQELIRRALDLDDDPLSPEHEALIAKRLAEHKSDPSSAVSEDAMNARLRARFRE